MNNIFSSFNIRFILSVTVLFFLSFSAAAQSKTTTHEDERFKADAAGLAYIQCKYDVTKYNSETKQNSTALTKELYDIALAYRQFSMLVDEKYKKDPELYKKFNQEVAGMKKRLKTCQKYQDIVTANEKIDKMKPKSSQ